MDLLWSHDVLLMEGNVMPWITNQRGSRHRKMRGIPARKRAFESRKNKWTRASPAVPRVIRRAFP